jgi:ADP-ribose pyrophosphatase YjhB (NUDIX family)
MKADYRFCPLCGTALERGVIEGKERNYCPDCEFVHYENPLPVAVAVAVKDKKFLLIKRGIPPRKGTWGSPSGFIETGETPEEACLRELKEETGVSGSIVRLADVFRIVDNEIYGDMLVMRYIVTAGDDELVPGDEVEDARFFAISELPDTYSRRFKELIAEIEGAS